MDVRRLLARLGSAIAAIVPRRRAGSPSLMTVAGARSPAPSGVGPSLVGPRSHGEALTSWLRDGRRLRLRVGARSIPTSQTDALGRRQEADPSPSPASVSFSRSVPQAIPGASVAATDGAPHARASMPTTPAPSASVPSASVPSASTLPPDIRVDFTGELSAATLAAIEQLDATQRRLIFLRYLVEQGIYNEGFSEHPLPEQYWRSRGVSEPPAQ